MGISEKGNEKGQVLKCIKKEIWKSLTIMIEKMKGKDWLKMKGKDWKEQNFKIPRKSKKKCCNLWKIEKIANMHQKLYYSSKIQVEQGI